MVDRRMVCINAVRNWYLYDLCLESLMLFVVGESVYR